MKDGAADGRLRVPQADAMAYNRKVDFLQGAKRGYAARSIYKLEAIDERFKLIRRQDEPRSGLRS